MVLLSCLALSLSWPATTEIFLFGIISACLCRINDLRNKFSLPGVYCTCLGSQVHTEMHQYVCVCLQHEGESRVHEASGGTKNVLVSWDLMPTVTFKLLRVWPGIQETQWVVRPLLWGGELWRKSCTQYIILVCNMEGCTLSQKTIKLKRIGI